MPIAALTSDTVRAIGASQVLTDSASVVKELIDNALDARASAIFIEISSNTLDIIQVKDNGFGIAPVDRALVCKRYCTSKITSFEDIVAIGGQSLGFRGEALASAAEMSGFLVVSTRVEGEATAVSLKIERQGSIENEERSSHPVGTTIRIVDFLKAIPVRRQSALKTYTKILSKIKTLVQAYALARPNVKFSLKVLKAKTDKGNLVYAPKPEASTTDAATKIVGKKITEQCQWEIWSSVNADHQNSNQEIYKFEALLPKLQCDVPSICNAGQFLSVDSRPVSCTRGTFKQIISLFKSCLNSALVQQNSDKIIDPFLCMNIVCPAASYDANVEPAKDDVMFTDAGFVLKLAENCFRTIYGEPTADGTPNPLPSKSKSTTNQGFDLLLARKESAPEQQATERRDDGNTPLHEYPPDSSAQIPLRSPGVVNRSGAQDISPGPVALLDVATVHYSLETIEPPSRTAWKANMFTVSDNDDDDLANFPGQVENREQARDRDDESELRSVQVSNPWTIAKVNTSLRPTSDRSNNVLPLIPGRQKGDVENIVEHRPHETRPAPRALPSPERTQFSVSGTDEHSSSPDIFPYPLTARRPRAENATARSISPAQSSPHNQDGNQARGLDTWVQRSQPHSQSSPSTAIGDGPDKSRLPDFVSARTLPTGTPLSEIPSLPQRRPRKPGARKQAQQGAGINKPFISPVNDPSKVWFDVGSSSGNSARSPQKRTAQIRNNNEDRSLFLANETNDMEPDQGNRAFGHSDLAETLDYETRKADAMQARKAYLRQQALTSKQQGNSRHTNRYNKAVAALNSDNTSTTGETHLPPDKSSAFTPGDPRAYLLRLRRRSQTPSARSERDRSISPSRARIRRRKNAMLPLESINEDSVTRDLELVCASVDLVGMKRDVGGEVEADDYVRSGRVGWGLNEGRSIEVARGWEDEVRLMMGRDYRADRGLGEQVPLRIELWTALQEHYRRCDDGDDDDDDEDGDDGAVTAI